MPRPELLVPPGIAEQPSLMHLEQDQVDDVRVDKHIALQQEV